MAAMIGSCEMSRQSSLLSEEANQISKQSNELSQRATDVSKEANEISRSALNNTVDSQNREKDNEDELAAIILTDSVDSLRQPISHCNTVAIRFRNYTNKSKTVSPIIRSNNLCLHASAGACPEGCKYELALPSFVVEPLGTYTNQVKIHIRADHPGDASVDLYNGSRFIRHFSYKMDNDVYYAN